MCYEQCSPLGLRCRLTLFNGFLPYPRLSPRCPAEFPQQGGTADLTSCSGNLTVSPISPLLSVTGFDYKRSKGLDHNFSLGLLTTSAEITCQLCRTSHGQWVQKCNTIGNLGTGTTRNFRKFGLRRGCGRPLRLALASGSLHRPLHRRRVYLGNGDHLNLTAAPRELSA